MTHTNTHTHTSIVTLYTIHTITHYTVTHTNTHTHTSIVTLYTVTHTHKEEKKLSKLLMKTETIQVYHKSSLSMLT